ncbi:helix-turn-helix transcriptional regulator [Cellulomonas iranensis]|uniref:helix-turn-helix transcriptional regulator n=1 Tax=Cellulomonas iranensis TaxID=76862 RepID=UPI0013D86BD9|nr:hypothetical protein [Cellulomonas iranensis]
MSTIERDQEIVMAQAVELINGVRADAGRDPLTANTITSYYSKARRAAARRAGESESESEGEATGRWRGSGDFPAPVRQLSPRVAVWRAGDIIDWATRSVERAAIYAPPTRGKAATEG